MLMFLFKALLTLHNAAQLFATYHWNLNMNLTSVFQSDRATVRHWSHRLQVSAGNYM